MSDWIYYHNPRCGKSREGKELLESHHIPLTVKEYLKEPLSEKEVERLIDLLNMEPLQMVRIKEQVFKDLELGKRKLGRKEWVRLIIQHPILLERPILAGKSKAIIGRPPEKLLEIV